MSPQRPRMLAVVRRFKWGHIDYLLALAEHFEVLVAYVGEGGTGAVQDGIDDGMRAVALGGPDEIGSDGLRRRLAGLIDDFRPDLVHVMYYLHEELTLLVRELVGSDLPVVYECRDPLTTILPGDGSLVLERDAILASDRQIFISRAVRDYLARTHDLDLSDSLVIPWAYPGNVVGPPRPKLSAADGRSHIALVGTADDKPEHGRWYGEIIRSLVAQGLVVHSHFFDLREFGLSLDPYHALAEELDDYHCHPEVSSREPNKLSDLISRYDLMGVFHELDAPHHNESATLAVCLPTKAICGWLYGGIPVVCFPHYAGVVERIEDYGIGFVVDDIEGVGAVAADREAIAAATERCLDCRNEFTTEWTAERVSGFLAGLPSAK